ncbi:MAG: hypothetical protein FJ299_02685 [Planctomycetes bacterium]|nr:hypothetical protein [Planctomycetota bacterium]
MGYELLHGQVTRAQGIFSPRSLHLHFSLEYIAENIEAPCVVLQYPSRRELIRELKKGYDYVGVSFLLAVFHRMKEVIALVRKHAPDSKIVLGGYGTVLSDAELATFSDYVCREEGVGFMRRLLGEPEIEMPYRHPLVVSEPRIFGRAVSRTGMVFAGLGCPNGCDFCCTSHFFKRRHIRLLPTGADIYDVVARYLEFDPEITLVVLDEDFLLNRRRALEFRDRVVHQGRPLSIFAFASIKAISQYAIEDLCEMGIDGLWIGYEGARSGLAKQEGRDLVELFADLRAHGISVLASMIVGLPYQNEAVVRSELEGLLSLKPDLCQFLIYGPTPGTPFFERVQREGLLHEDLAKDPELYYRKCDGFTAMVQHPVMSAQVIESLQSSCFHEDFQRLGPSIFRMIETWLLGHRTLRRSTRPIAQAKSERFGHEIRKAYPVFLAGRLFGPNATIRRRIRRLQREIHAEFGRPTWAENMRSVLAVGLALWTMLTLRLRVFQHPSLVKHAYRLPDESLSPNRAWQRLTKLGGRVSVELRAERTVWVHLDGALGAMEAARIARQAGEALRRTRNRLVLDMSRLTHIEHEAAQHLVEPLREYRKRIRLLAPIAPAIGADARVASALAVFGLYHGSGLAT